MSGEREPVPKRAIGKVLTTALVVIGIALIIFPTLTDLYTNLVQRDQKRLVAEAFAEKKELPKDAVTILEIPRLKLETVVYEGIEDKVLRRGPGHWPKTALPWERGNCVIVGHRNIYGSVFKDLDKMQYDDPFYLHGKDGKYKYRVISIRIVKPTETQVILPTGVNMATLITCHPYYKPTMRLVIHGVLTEIIPYNKKT